MRKRLLLFVILIAVAMGGLPWIHATVDDDKDNVPIYEEVFTGNPSWAEGLVIESTTHMDQRLYWDTVIRPGNEELAETEFTFVADRRPYTYGVESQIQLSLASGNFGMGGTFSMEEMLNQSVSPDSYSYLSHAQGQIWKPVVDVATRAPSGWVEYKEVVKLKDYYDVYPLAMDLYFDDSGLERAIWIEEDDVENDEKLSRFFAVAIPDSIELEIIIMKDDYGNVVETNCQYTEETARLHPYIYGDNFFMKGVLTAEGGYFTLGRIKEDPTNDYATVLDSPRLKDDYGIYFVPLVEHMDGGVTYEGYNPERITDMDQLKNVFPLSEGVNALGLYHDEESDWLILLTEESDGLWGTVIDRKNMTELQKVNMGSIKENEYIDEVFLEGDSMLVMLMENYVEGRVVTPKRLVYLHKKAGAWNCEVRGTMNWPGQEETYYGMSEFTQMAWDGERLAVVQWDRYRSNCNIRVLGYAEDELKYAGVYQRRDTAGGVYDYNRMVQPWHDVDGLKAYWE